MEREWALLEQLHGITQHSTLPQWNDVVSKNLPPTSYFGTGLLAPPGVVGHVASWYYKVTAVYVHRACMYTHGACHNTATCFMLIPIYLHEPNLHRRVVRTYQTSPKNLNLHPVLAQLRGAGVKPDGDGQAHIVADAEGVTTLLRNNAYNDAKVVCPDDSGVRGQVTDYLFLHFHTDGTIDITG